MQPPPLPEMPPITCYIDPTAGDDARDGRTPETARRTLPLQNFQATTKPGDHFAFRRGTVVRGTVNTAIGDRPRGQWDKQITVSGNAWGEGPRCQVAGDNVAFTRPPEPPVSQQDAGGHPGWNNGQLLVCEFPPEKDGPQNCSEFGWMFDGHGAMERAQWPRPADMYQIDATDKDSGQYFLLGMDGLYDGLTNEAAIDSAPLAALLSGEPFASLWINKDPNIYSRQHVASVVGSKVYLAEYVAGGQLGFYKGTADNAGNHRIFLQDRLKDVDAPGKWAMLSPTKALVWPRALGGAITRASGWQQRPIKSLKQTVVRGFDFNRWAGVDDNTALVSLGNGTGAEAQGNNRLLDCVIHEICSTFKGGTVSIVSAGSGPDTRITHNRVYNIMSQAYVFGGLSPQYEVAWNVIYRSGGEPLRLYNSTNAGAHVHHNIFSDVAGVHTNGVASYQNNERVLLEYNAIFNVVRPLTMQGRCTTWRTFRRNLLAARQDEKGYVIRRDGAPPYSEVSDNLLLPYPSYPAIANGTDAPVAGEPRLTARGNRVIDIRDPARPEAQPLIFGKAPVAGHEYEDNGYVPSDYLAGATIEKDLVDFVFPATAEKPAEPFRLDLRGVGVGVTYVPGDGEPVAPEEPEEEEPWVVPAERTLVLE